MLFDSLKSNKYLISMKTILTFLLLGTLHLASGQIAKGTWALGPDIDYSYSKTTLEVIGWEVKSTDLNVGAAVGYYVMDNLEIGLSMGILSSKDEVDDLTVTESSTSGLYVGPHVQYKVSLSDRFYLPIGGRVSYNSLTSENEGVDDVTYTGISFGLFTGIEFVENNKVGVSLTFGPEFGNLDETDAERGIDVTTFGVGMGFRFYF
jgi:hypothetical protein